MDFSIECVRVTLADDLAEAGELSELQHGPLVACAGLLGANQGRTVQGDLQGQRLQPGQGGSQQRSRDQPAVLVSQPHKTGDTCLPPGTSGIVLSDPEVHFPP